MTGEPYCNKIAYPDGDTAAWHRPFREKKLGTRPGRVIEEVDEKSVRVKWLDNGWESIVWRSDLLTAEEHAKHE